jgi:hypothetical protein
LPIDEDESEEAINISPGLVTQGILLALAIYLVIPALSHIIESYVRDPSAFRWRSQIENMVDLGLGVVLILSSLAATQRANRIVMEANAEETGPGDSGRDHAVARLQEGVGPRA